MGKTKRKTFADLGNILVDFGNSGDRTKATRRLNIQAINLSRKKMPKQADLFKLMVKRIRR